MEKYYALDYVDEHECELVCDNKVYYTRAEAEAARVALPHPDLYEINWYTLADLADIYETEVYVDENMNVHYVEW